MGTQHGNKHADGTDGTRKSYRCLSQTRTSYKNTPSTELDRTHASGKRGRAKSAPNPSPTKRSFDNRTLVIFARSIPTPKTSNAKPPPYAKHHHIITISSCDEPNMTDNELRSWKRDHDRQQHLASLPLFNNICYKCGELLFPKCVVIRNKDNSNDIVMWSVGMYCGE